MDEKEAAVQVKKELNNMDTSNSTPLFDQDDAASKKDAASPANTTQGLIEKALIAAKDLKEQLDRKEKLIQIEQENEARRLLAGSIDAGQTIKAKSKEEIIREEANKLLEKTGLKI